MFGLYRCWKITTVRRINFSNPVVVVVVVALTNRCRHSVIGYVVVDEANQTMFAVDPAESSKILAVLKEEETTRNRAFLGVLTTHKHEYVVSLGYRAVT